MWYKNPTIAAILGAVVGAILTGIIGFITAWRVAKKQRTANRNVRRVECFIRQASSLMSFSESIKDKIEVKIENQSISSLYLFKLDIISTGNQAVRNQPVQFRLGEETKILSHSIETEPKVGFGKVKTNIIDGGIDLLIDLMNPGDKVSLSVMSHNNPEGVIDVYMKNEDVENAVHSFDDAEIIKNVPFDQLFLSLATILGSIPIFGWMFRGFAQFAMFQKIDELSNELKKIASQR